jgi:hypothetical protein
MMKRWIGDIALLLTSLIISLGLGEILVRQTLSPPQKYEDILRNLVDRPERLFNARSSTLYDIKGLYEGADTVELNVGNDRFIEPQPQGFHKYHILFLGGSTTEAMYVPQRERWVALLNQPAVVAAYNAAQSGANTIDEYFTFLYLTAQGMKFDLVVLATGINDMYWLQQFEKYGNRFVTEEYKKGLQDYNAREFGSKENTFDQPWRRSALYLLIAEAFKNLSNLGPPLRVVPNVTQILLDMRQTALSNFTDERRPAGVRLMDRYPYLEEINQEYRAATTHNIGLLHQAVSRTGARLLVLTEATSWLAPTTSFYQDLRIPIDGMRSFEDLHEYRLLLNGFYLEAAKRAGALTYDLAADVNPYSNGPSGGKYMYDSLHYTPEGCRLVASFMRSVLHRLLKRGSLE